MAKTRILFIVSGQHFGNDQRKLLAVIRSLDRQKYEFSIICSENRILLASLKDLDSPVYVIELPSRISTKFTSLLQKLHDGEKFNIVHSFGYNAGIYSRHLKKTAPGLLCVHSPAPYTYIEKDNFLSRQLKKTTEQYLAQFTDILICENNIEKKLVLKNKYADKNRIAVIPCSVNIETFANRKKEPFILSSLGLNKNHFIIGNISNFEEFDNQQIIVRSAYYLSKKFPNIRFLFIGEGSRLSKMKELARISSLEQNIIFIGEIDNPEDYYSIMDMFILADIHGGSSAIMLEAMASRLPIICSLSSSYLQIAKYDINSLTFDPSDMDDLFEKTAFLYSSGELRQKLAQNAMIESTQFDDSVIIPKIEQVYRGEFIF